MVEPIKTVVLADTGDLFLRSMTEAINSESDLRVVGSTGDGPQLLELIQKLHPDAVAMELVLSRMDGLEVLAALQKLPADQRPRILVLSSYVQGTMADLAAAQGADYYLSKPCRPSVVCERLRQITRVGTGQVAPSRSMEAQVTAIIHDVGVPAHIKATSICGRPSSSPWPIWT